MAGDRVSISLFELLALKMVAWSLSSTFIPAKLLPCYFINLFIESGESKVNLLVIVFYLCYILFKIYLFWLS